jgi:GTP pyrophosphokinase
VDDVEKLFIHKRECSEAAKLKSSFGKRLVSVDWATHKALSFIQTLEIKGIDKQGVMIEILKVISEKFGGNISKITIETNDGIFIGHFSISVHDTEDIELLCKNIKKISEITSVQRV